MSTTSGKRNIATTKTAHTAVAPPATSMVPPPATAVNPPVFAPFVYTARSQTAAETSERLKVGGAPVLVVGSVLNVDPPANAPALPSGDIVTAAKVKKGHVKDGSSQTTSGGKGVALTGSLVAMNVLIGSEEVAQVTAPLMEAAGGSAAGEEGGGTEGKDKNKKSPVPGRSASRCTVDGHPVDVATGFVVDSAVDLQLPGAIPLIWKRFYSSAAAGEKATGLGVGGWFHSFDQWVEPIDGGFRYETGEGIQVAILKGENGAYFHRGKRLVLTESGRGEVSVSGLSDRLTRVFAKIRNHDRLYLVAIRDAWGNAIRLEYKAGTLSRVVDTAGREVRVISDEKRRVTRLEVFGAGRADRGDENGREPLLWVNYQYHFEGELASVQNALGFSDQFEYDGRHRMVKTTLKNGVSFYYEYDEKGRCKRTWGDSDARLFGGVGTLSAGSQGSAAASPDTAGTLGGDAFHVGGAALLPLHNVHFSFAPGGVTTTSGTRNPRRYVANASGLVTLEETFGGEFAIVREYDEAEFLLSEANAAGEATKFEYDLRGNLVRKTDTAGNSVTWEFVDDLPRRRLDPGLEGSLTTEFHHDGYGALIRVKLPTGALIQYKYDSAGHIVEVSTNEGRLVTFERDSQHNLVTEQNSRGATTRYRYDALGRPVERIDALGRVTVVRYNVLGQPIEVVFPDGSVTRSTYDPLGQLASSTDALGQTSRFEYGGTGVLVRVIQPDGHVYRFCYDEDEQLRRVVNPRAEEYSFDYDQAGRVTRERTFDARWLEYQYNKASRLTRIQYSADDFRSFAYDALGGLLEDRCPDGGTVFERDKLGRLHKATVEDWKNTDIVTELRYDKFGRFVSEKQASGEVEYEYDLLNRRTARTVRAAGLAGRTTRYKYALDGALTGIDHQGQRVAIEHDALGREIRKHVYSGSVDIQSRYDALDLLVEQRVTAAGRPDQDPSLGAALGREAQALRGALGSEAQALRDPALAAGQAFRALVHRKWTYDSAGRPTSIGDDRWGTSAYTYDKAGQLREAHRGNQLEIFEYDPTGSLQKILDQVGGPATPRWNLQEGNRLTRTEKARFRDDERGRRIQKIEFAEGEDPGPRATPRPENKVTLYGWDARDRLREVVLPDKSKVRFWYDAFGRRVKKEVFPAELSDFRAMAQLALEKGPDALPKLRVVEYIWDGDVLAAEVERQRTGEPWSRFHVHQPGTFVPVLQEEAGCVFAVVTDHLGMPKELIDRDGCIAWSAAHSAWGRVTEVYRDPKSVARFGEVESPFRLLGQYEDSETGLCTTRFRYFDAEQGRWLSPDPLGIFGGKNLLGFDGCPTFAVDPLGLACEVDAATQEKLRGMEGHPLVYEIARLIEERYPGHVLAINMKSKKIGERGHNTDFDAETPNAVLQIKGGPGTGLAPQIRERTIPNTPKVVIGFAANPNWKQLREFQRSGLLITNDINILLGVVAPDPVS